MEGKVGMVQTNLGHPSKYYVDGGGLSTKSGGTSCISGTRQMMRFS
jgi:hypothetical protein